MSNSSQLLSLKHRKLIILSLLIAAGGYLVVASYIGLDNVTRAFAMLGATGWLLILACSFTSYILRFVRWQMYLKRLGHRLPTTLHFVYYLSGFALTTTPAKAGETIRSLLLRPHGVTYPQSLSCFFSERLLDVIIVASLASLTILAFSEYTQYVISGFIFFTLVLLIIRSTVLTRVLKHLNNKIHYTRLQNMLDHAHLLLLSAQQFFKLKILIAGYAIGLLAWSIQGLAFYYILISLGFDISLYAAMGIYAFSLLAGAASFIPGGIGSTELAMGILLNSLGADTTIVISAPLISRLSTLWFAVLLGLLSTTFLSIRPATHPAGSNNKASD